MANLPSDDLDEVWKLIMSRYSGSHEEIPINKHQLRALLTIMDDELEAAEIAIIQALPDGAGKIG